LGDITQLRENAVLLVDNRFRVASYIIYIKTLKTTSIYVTN